jgi:hypothetical protein
MQNHPQTRVAMQIGATMYKNNNSTKGKLMSLIDQVERGKKILVKRECVFQWGNFEESPSNHFGVVTNSYLAYVIQGLREGGFKGVGKINVRMAIDELMESAVEVGN